MNIKWAVMATATAALFIGLIFMAGGPVEGAPTPGSALKVQDGTPWPVRVEVPASVGGVDSGLRDSMGQAIIVGCATCHEDHKTAPTIDRVEDFTTFHLDMAFDHGEQSCFACHDRAQRQLLRMADGQTVELVEAQRLCSQCHGTQARDWAHGAHGGMNGYWDLRQGPRTRGSCVSCHNAHSPAWPQVQPVFAPRDRFLESPNKAH